MKSQKNGIKPGVLASAIVYVWSEDEIPTTDNFFTGKIARIFERTPKSNVFWVKFVGLDKIIPLDRVRLIGG